MDLVSSLYALRADEAQGQLWAIVTRALDVSAASTLVNITDWFLPPNGLLVLKHLVVTANPGASQFPTALQFLATNVRIGGTYTVAEIQFSTGIAGLELFLPWDGELVLPLQDLQLTAQAFFNAGAQSNILACSVQGLWFPQGNGSWA